MSHFDNKIKFMNSLIYVILSHCNIHPKKRTLEALLDELLD